MYYTGFADEAGAQIDTQIKATKELGWSNIELRATGFNGDLATMSDEDFDKLYAKIAESGVKINCFGSGIANWGKDIKAPFEDTVRDIEKAIPRMNKLGTKLVRIMSYAIRRDPNTGKVLPESEQYFEERVKRLKEILKRFYDAGITPVHENCMNYGGLSWQHTLRLIEAVPDLKLVYDTGNPPFSEDLSKKPNPDGRYPYQDSWEFYSHVKDYVIYVHIKDARGKAQHKKGEIFPSGQEFCFPGEGNGAVKEIVNDLLKRGYDGGFSIEPHMQVVFHEGDSNKNKEEAKYQIYIEYGKRFMKIVEDAMKNIKK